MHRNALVKHQGAYAIFQTLGRGGLFDDGCLFDDGRLFDDGCLFDDGRLMMMGAYSMMGAWMIVGSVVLLAHFLIHRQLYHYKAFFRHTLV